MSDVDIPVQPVKDFLDALIEVFNLGSDFSKVSKILEISGKLVSAFPAVGAVLVLIGESLPDSKHEEILRCFQELYNKIDQVRADIKELKNVITWEITALQYGDDVSRIQKGIKYWSEIVKATAKDERMRYQARLKDLCANQNYILALDNLFDGVIGNELLKSSILDQFYNKTKGDRPRISALATRLLQLIFGGMLVIAAYERVINGKEGAKEILQSYGSRLKEVCAKILSVLEQCVENFQGNMVNDLNGFLDAGRSNKILLTEVKDFMRDKYDWLEHFCLVYNDLLDSEKHCCKGDCVESLHRNGKCGIVFYRTKGDPQRFSGRYDEAYNIVDDACKTIDGTWFGNAEDGYKDIVAKMDAMHIGWTGCAVITSCPDLSFDGTFSTKTVTVIGKNVTAILLLQ